MGLVVSPVSRDLPVRFWGGHPLFFMQLLIPTLLFGELGAKKRDQKQCQSLPWTSPLGVCWLPPLEQEMIWEMHQVRAANMSSPAQGPWLIAPRPAMLMWCPRWGPSAAAGQTTGKVGQSPQQHCS